MAPIPENTLPDISIGQPIGYCVVHCLGRAEPPSVTRRPCSTYSWQRGPTSTRRKLPLIFVAFVLPLLALQFPIRCTLHSDSEECQPSFPWSNVPWYWSIRTSGFLRILGGYFILNDTSRWECRHCSNLSLLFATSWLTELISVHFVASFVSIISFYWQGLT